MVESRHKRPHHSQVQANLLLERNHSALLTNNKVDLEERWV